MLSARAWDSMRRRFISEKQRFGGMDVSEAQRLRAMEDENHSDL